MSFTTKILAYLYINGLFVNFFPPRLLSQLFTLHMFLKEDKTKKICQWPCFYLGTHKKHSATALVDWNDTHT